MITPKEILGHLPAGRVLDVATGTGSFIHFLLEGLPGYTEIIAIDSSPRGEPAFASAFGARGDIHFQVMDARQMTFDQGCFDLVCISNSLHHLDNPLPVLQEMQRVLRPGGYLLVNEMYCDHQTETQLTHVHLHHWWAAVDRVNGVVHNETYRREELVELCAQLGLSGVKLFDLEDLSPDPHDPELLTELDPAFDRYLQRAEGHAHLRARGDELRQRLKEIGFHAATSLVMIGEKHA